VYQPSTGQLFVFMAGVDGFLYDKSWDGTQWVWQAHGTPPQSELFGPPSAVYQASTGQLAIFVVDGENYAHLWEWDGTQWEDQAVPGFPASPISITASPDVLWTGQSSTGTVMLGDGTTVTPQGTTVTLSISDAAGVTISGPAGVTVPTSAFIAAEAPSATFPITAAATATTASVWFINATGPDGVTGATPITVLPGQISVSVQASEDPPLLPGQTATGTILVRTPAPASGEPITLSTNHPEAVSITPPPGGKISAGATSATFTVTALGVPPKKGFVAGITITASFGGGSATSEPFGVVRKIFQPPPPPPPPGGGPRPNPMIGPARPSSVASKTHRHHLGP